MDQFSAHLDRGWDLVQRGDVRGAETSARRALELDSSSPEVYNLLGYIANLDGEFDDAVEHYRQAIALDDGYVDAMLNAAEVYIHPLEDFESAMDLIDQTLDLADTDDIRVDALLLKFDALLAQGDLEGGAKVARTIPDGPYENPAHTFLVGRAFYEIGDLDRASKLIEEAMKVDPGNPDAAYYLALVREDQGNPRAATEAFLLARELDFEVAPPPWALTPDVFAVSARRVFARIDPELRGIVDASEVYVAELPGAEVVVDGVDPRQLVLVDRLDAADNVEPKKGRAFVYQRNVERVVGALDALEPELLAAIERELRAVFFDDAGEPPQKLAD